MIRLFAAISLLSLLSGCAAAQASSKDTLPQENATQCRSLCASVGMPLESIVIVANQTGCVCGASADAGADGGSAAATGGAVAVLLAEEQKRQQQQQ